ncbi:MAG: hypothetical protein H6766_00215 [Candidatus Peribacteria bacterium]|nr:MAG: hypothetical protein H6766_00215 [Candidatus Peribacteria bacterium]
MWQFTMFKTGIVIIGILLTYIIPGLLHINIARYTALWGLGAGYFLDHILRK